MAGERRKLKDRRTVKEGEGMKEKRRKEGEGRKEKEGN